MPSRVTVGLPQVGHVQSRPPRTNQPDKRRRRPGVCGQSRREKSSGLSPPFAVASCPDEIRGHRCCKRRSSPRGTGCLSLGILANGIKARALDTPSNRFFLRDVAYLRHVLRCFFNPFGSSGVTRFIQVYRKRRRMIL